MSNPAYVRGANFERWFMKQLGNGKNYMHAMRSAGSHGAVDVIELRTGRAGPEVWCYQIKCSKVFAVYQHELAMMDFLEEHGVNVRFVWRSDRKVSKRVHVYTLAETYVTAKIRRMTPSWRSGKTMASAEAKAPAQLRRGKPQVF